MSEILPVKDDIKAYCWVVFSYLDGLVPLRSFSEKGGGNKPPSCFWVDADDNITDKVFDFAEFANRKKAGCYVIPAVVEKIGQAKSQDIKQMQVLLIDLDNGDIESKLALLENSLGEATLIVESGGVTNDGQAKLHVYWQLIRAVSGEDLQKLLALRYKIAIAVGGDTSFKSAHQPIRVAGSVYHKHGNPKLVKIRSYSRVEYELEELIENAKKLPASAAIHLNSDIFNVNNAVSGIRAISRTLVNKVYEGGIGENTRFNCLSKVIGYWLRRYHEGLITHEEALEEIHSYNLANVVPPWSKERLQQEINNLWKLHIKKYGEPKKVSNPNIDIFDLDYFLTDKSELPQDIIAPRILTPRGILVFGGAAKVGKSDFLLSLFAHLTAGVEFLGFKPTKPLKIFYFQTEVEYYYLRERLQNIKLPKELLEKARRNLYITPSNKKISLNDEGIKKIVENVKKALNGLPDIIAIDPIRNVFDGGKSGATENENDAMIFFLKERIEALRDQINPEAGIILVHHTRKITHAQFDEDPFQAFSGASSLRGYYTTGILLYQPEPKNKNKHLIFELRNGKKIPTKILQKENDIWTEVSTLEERIVNKVRSKLYDCERERRINVIIRLLESEALRGKFYLMKQFAEKYQNHIDLGGRRAIYDDCTVAATKGIIKFFDNPEKYNIQFIYTGKGFGFMCTKNMQMGVKITNPVNGKIITDYVKILPTHLKNECDGRKEKIINNIKG